MQRIAIAVALIGLTSCRQSPGPLAIESPPPPPSLAPAQLSAAVAGRFIVTLRAGTTAATVNAGLGLQPERVYTRAINGFSARLSDAVVQTLLRDTRIISIEPDGIVSVTSVQGQAVWGLDRIDQRALPLNDKYRYTKTGLGVTAYVIDTGIRFDHAEFGGRAVSLVDEIDGGKANDCMGHGTHVAGTLGGATYGVAKEVSLVAVRVLDCDGFGTWSGVIAGIEAIIAAHEDGVPAVANMSLGGEKRASVSAAVRSLIADGVTTVVSAGNGTADACSQTPASVRGAITIGATDETDRKASFSNFGDCVDWFAPGVGIKSAYVDGSTSVAFLSGTSMASPHVAGVAALYLQDDPAARPSAVRAALFDKATKGVVTSSGSANNHLLFAR